MTTLIIRALTYVARAFNVKTSDATDIKRRESNKMTTTTTKQDTTRRNKTNENEIEFAHQQQSNAPHAHKHNRPTSTVSHSVVVKWNCASLVCKCLRYQQLKFRERQSERQGAHFNRRLIGVCGDQDNLLNSNACCFINICFTANFIRFLFLL